MSKKFGSLWAVAGLLAAAVSLSLPGASAQQSASTQQKILVLEGGTLIDGTGRAPIIDAVIVVQGNRIASVGRKGQVTVPAGARVINLAGRTILPGLIDIHTHTQDWQIPMFLPWGVTTIADENNNPAWILEQRAGLKSGKIKGPRMFVAGTLMHGTLFQIPNAAKNNTPDVTTAEQARAHAKAMVALGVDIVKVNSNITDDQLKAAVEVADAAGLPVFGHTQNMMRASQLGMKHAEHMFTIAFALLDPTEKNPPPSPLEMRIPPESRIEPSTFPPLVDYLIKQGVYLNPTLVNNWGAFSPSAQALHDEAVQIIKDPGLGFVPPEVKESWTRTEGLNALRGDAALLPPRTAAFVAGYKNVAEFLRQWAKAGGKITVGTDSGPNGRVIPGLSEHQEMRSFVDVGFTPMQAIQAATLWNAELLRKDKELGSIEPGKLADFAIIEGDPLTDIGATKNIRMVIKEGEVMDTKYDPHWVNPIPMPLSSNERDPPIIVGLFPSKAPQGGKTVTLTLEAKNQENDFAPDAIVRFDTTDLPTHFINGKKLTAELPARLLQRPMGSYAVYVVNPGIHGTVSEPAYFVVTFKQ